MPINPALLICAPVLQDAFIDPSTGLPMYSGICTFYQDNSRTTLKNVYYQSGSPGAYTYIPLPNPLTLSAAGAIEDANGVDTIPFFYPYSETDNQTFQPYFIRIQNSSQTNEITRENFPYVPQTPVLNDVNTLDNVLVNNVFWRNVGTLDATSVTQSVLAPGAHDGFSMPDIQFLKSVAGADDNITFTPFGLGVSPLVGDITPEVYVNHNCTSVQAGETQKCYQFPICLHIKTLESVSATITIQAQNVGGNVNNQINLYIYQFLGTGVGSPSPIAVQTITVNSTWQKYTINFTFPSATGATLGSGGDDALYLQIGMPLSAVFEINFCKPSIYLNNEVPTDDFQTYDQIDSIINSARTGDFRTSLNAFQPYGWVAANDGLIGGATSSATTRANIDTWPLFSLIWNNVLNNWSPVTLTGTTANIGGAGAGPISVAVAGITAASSITGTVVTSTNPVTVSVITATSTGFDVTLSGDPGATLTVRYVATGRGTTAIDDFTNKKAITLTRTLGRVLAGLNAQGLSAPITFTTLYASSHFNLTIAATTGLTTGSPVVLANVGGGLPSGLAINTLYYAIYTAGATTVQLATTLENAYAGTPIDIGNDQTGTSSLLDGLGVYSGTDLHVISSGELPAHTHGFSGVTSTTTAGAGGAVGAIATFGATVTGSTGSSTAMSLLQPTTFVNVFLKL